MITYKPSCCLRPGNNGRNFGVGKNSPHVKTVGLIPVKTQWICSGLKFWLWNLKKCCADDLATLLHLPWEENTDEIGRSSTRLCLVQEVITLEARICIFFITAKYGNIRSCFKVLLLFYNDVRLFGLSQTRIDPLIQWEVHLCWLIIQQLI